MNNREQELILQYWSKTDIGKKMILSNHVSYSDLLFMIPNNVKRRYGLPTTRTCGKRKSQIKRNRRHHIMAFNLFDIFEEIIDDTFSKPFDVKYFQNFVDVKNMQQGDFEITPRFDVSLTSSLYKPYFRIGL